MRGAAEGKKLEGGVIRAMISFLLAAFFGQWREREIRGGCNEIANLIQIGCAETALHQTAVLLRTF